MSAILHQESQHRFTIDLDGEQGFLEYAINETESGVELDFYHTEVPPSHQGQGIASRLVKFGMEYAKEHGFAVLPSCSYVKAWIEKHP